MRALLNIDDELLNEAKEITGMPEEATVQEALRRLVDNHQRMTAIEAMHGIGWDGPHYSRPTFEILASEFRELIAGRNHTPSEELMREGRDDR